jgi:hypothetical protein
VLERLSNDDISTALDELVASLGVKEEAPCADLFIMLQKKIHKGAYRK